MPDKFAMTTLRKVATSASRTRAKMESGAAPLLVAPLFATNHLRFGEKLAWSTKPVIIGAACLLNVYNVE